MENKLINLSVYKKVPKFIAVEGPIGAGKTTLTKLLADSFGYDTFLEKPSENPFLPDFYINPSQAALATQLFFLFQRVKQIQELMQGDIFSSNRVSDFLLDKDMLFAKSAAKVDSFRPEVAADTFNEPEVDDAIANAAAEISGEAAAERAAPAEE